MQRSEAKKLEDISRHELEAILCRFLMKFEKKDSDESEPESRKGDGKMVQSSFGHFVDDFHQSIDRCCIFTL